MPDALDHPVWAALTGPHAHLAQTNGSAVRYPSDVSLFAAVAPGAGEAGWADLATLVGPDGSVLLAGPDLAPPPGWERVLEIPGVQLVDTSMVAAADPAAQQLGPGDVADMLDLVERTEPGPFAKRTIELGRYLGIRDRDRLIAMAGERLRPPGWVEISAVCTDPTYRGQGLAARLVRAIAAGIRADGAIPFLHAGAHNTRAIRLYLALGFTHHQDITFLLLRPPPAPIQSSAPSSVPAKAAVRVPALPESF